MSENEVAFFFYFSEKDVKMQCRLMLLLPHDYYFTGVRCVPPFFRFLKKHHLLASVDPHDPPDETDEATRSFLSLSFLCASLGLLFQPVIFTPFVVMTVLDFPQRITVLPLIFAKKIPFGSDIKF